MFAKAGWPRVCGTRGHNLVGYALVLTAVIGFGFTFIAVDLGEQSFSPLVMSVGRVVPGAIAAIIVLRMARQPLIPPRDAFPHVLGVTVGIVLGFPLLSTFALQAVPAADAGVVGSLMPLITGSLAMLFGYRRPSAGFWLAAGVGTLAAACLALLRAGSSAPDSAASQAGEGAGASAGFEAGMWGYVLLHVLCWAVMISVPVQLPLLVADLAAHPITAWPSVGAVIGFLFVSLFSIIFGNAMLNAGFYRIGLVRGSQLQLIQPIVTMLLSIAVLGEAVSGLTWLVAAVIIAAVAAAQRMPS